MKASGGSAVMAQQTQCERLSRDPNSPKEARAVGKRWYFTGRPCPKGHFSKRSVSNRECRACVDARRAGTETVRAKDRRRAKTDKRKAYTRAQYQKHKSKRHVYDAKRYLEPDRMAATKARSDQWWRKNLGKKNAMTARRRAQIKHATPQWLTRDQLREMRAIYIEASNRDGDWHVDHIVPLRGRAVCGLHVPWNLQIISAPENMRKANVFAA